MMGVILVMVSLVILNVEMNLFGVVVVGVICFVVISFRLM